MIKEIKYGGFSASPGDHEALEGDLCVSMNLIPERGTVRPVLPPSVIASVPGDPNLPNNKGRKVLCIHQTSTFKHFIVAVDYDGLSPQHPPYTHLYSWDGTEGTGLVRLGYKAFTQVHKVEPVGNTLVVLTDTGIHYYLWKQGEYRYLGNHIPELYLRFELTESKEFTSDEHKVDWDITGDGWSDAMTPIAWFDSEDKVTSRADVGKEVRAKLRQAIMASLNEVSADVCNDKRFAYPFFVRYGLRLYDERESITMHSAPALLIPTLNTPALDMGWAGISGDGTNVKNPAKVTATLTGYKLRVVPVNPAQLEELSLWSDIVLSVDIFISPQFYTYNQGAKDQEIVIDSPSPRPPLNTQLNRQVCDNSNFFLLKQIKLTSALLQYPGGNITPDFEPTNDNIVVRESMTDDNGTHDLLLADKSFAYNGRINLSGVSKKLFIGFSPGCMWYRVGNTSSNNTTTATVVVETDGREIVVESPAGVVFYDYRTNDKVLWFYYPHAGAKRAYMTLAGEIIELELTPHPGLNGAYYSSLDEDAVQRTVQTIPTPSTPDERLVAMPNKVYTSEVNNPFYFPTTGINSIGMGEIMGICAAVRPVSTGQMGYADLYIFADSGVWVAKINDKGSYSDVTLATGDVCINPDSITQLETSVLFSTDRGIMLISGSQAQCISEAIDDDGQPYYLRHPSVGTMATMLGLDISISPFKDFVQECRMIYDYAGQRIIVYNPGYNYAYIYSLESNKWGMMQSPIDYSVRAYPDALAVTRDGELVDCSGRVDYDAAPAASQLLITRPLTLDQPDMLKTVTAVLQRGMFRKHQGHVQPVLYGSRDLYNWEMVNSSDNENLRGRSGTPYKWFRVALLLKLEPGESITGCSIQFEPKYTNRLR